MAHQDIPSPRSGGEQAQLERYWQELSAYAPLSDEEEKALSSRILKGDTEATDRLVKANLRFVVSTARSYTSDVSTLLDLIDEGNSALIEAARKFDASKGKRFVNVAVWDIRRAMETFLELYRLDVRTTDVDSPHFDKLSSADPEDTEPSLTTIALDALPAREQLVMKACFGVGMPQMTMREVGMAYGMTRERVRQIRKRALRRLQTMKK